MPLCMGMIAPKTYANRSVADFLFFFQQGGRKPNRGEGKLSAAHVTSQRVSGAGELGYRLRAEMNTSPLSLFLLATHSELEIAHRGSIEGEISLRTYLSPILGLQLSLRTAICEIVL